MHNRQAASRTLRVLPLVRELGWRMSPAVGLPLLLLAGLILFGSLQKPEEILQSARAAWLEEADADLAARQYRKFVRRFNEHPLASDARVELASLVAGQLDQPVQAARLLEVAAKNQPTHAEAGEWLLLAADIASGAGHDQWAQRLWTRVADVHPSQASTALLNMARERIAQGDPAGAYADYQRVALDTASPEEVSLARIGMSICLERLGDRDAALAEMEAVDESDAGWRQRREALIGRRDAASVSIW